MALNLALILSSCLPHPLALSLVTSPTCCFIIMWATSLSLLLPVQNSVVHKIHYFFQLLMLLIGLQYIQEKLVENISQTTLLVLFSSPSSSSCSQSDIGISLVASFVLSSELLHSFSQFSPWIMQENPTEAVKLLCYDPPPKSFPKTPVCCVRRA